MKYETCCRRVATWAWACYEVEAMGRVIGRSGVSSLGASVASGEGETLERPVAGEDWLSAGCTSRTVSPSVPRRCPTRIRSGRGRGCWHVVALLVFLFLHHLVCSQTVESPPQESPQQVTNCPENHSRCIIPRLCPTVANSQYEPALLETRDGHSNVSTQSTHEPLLFRFRACQP